MIFHLKVSQIFWTYFAPEKCLWYCVSVCTWMLLKHTYRVDRAANHQSNTDMENYQKRPLKRPIIIIMNQHTWKCIKVALPERTE